MFKTWSASFLDQLSRYGQLSGTAPTYHLTLYEATNWPEVAYLLRTAGEVEYFILLSATHKPPYLHLRYDLRSLLHLTDIAVTFQVRETYEVPSVADIWPAANWQEREAYDLVGVRFARHPDLRRILLPADWEGHPLRRDYSMPESYRNIPLTYQSPSASV
ncbi:MAG: NADH-quinone oxidoreductase subunit C [Bacteroidia bacterium]